MERDETRRDKKRDKDNAEAQRTIEIRGENAEDIF
jgi:hypothetical protein